MSGELDALVPQALEAWDIPGASVAVVRGDSVIHLSGYGVRDRDDGTPVDEDTVFPIGSITKTFTAALAAILAEEGTIDMDDPVIDYLPDFRLQDPKVTMNVTFRDLLTHQSGLGSDNFLFWNNGLEREEIVHRLRHVPQVSDFRTSWEYNNLGYIAAGTALAASRQSSWETLISQRILVPLGMDRTRPVAGQALGLENMARPYGFIEGRVAPVPHLADNNGPAGAMVSSARDLAAWMTAHFDSLDESEGALFTREALDGMLAPHVLLPSDSPYQLMFPEDALPVQATGWISRRFGRHQVIEHGGQTDGAHAYLMMVPNERIGVVVLTNSSLMGFPAAVCMHVLGELLGEPERDWSAYYRERMAPINAFMIDPPGQGPPPGNPGVVSPERLAGRYIHDLYGELDIRPSDEALVLSVLGVEATLAHWNYDTYRLAWNDSLRGALVPFATVRVDPGGNPVAIDLGYPSIHVSGVFRRLPED